MSFIPFGRQKTTSVLTAIFRNNVLSSLKPGDRKECLLFYSGDKRPLVFLKLLFVFPPATVND